MAHRLFIGSLSFSTSSDRLRQMFSQLEGVEAVSVVTDRGTGQSRGFGFVDMASAEAAEAAIKKFNGAELDGRQLKVELAKPPGAGRGDDRRGGPRGGGGRRW
ncbi:MAG: RNA recognition motif domain-containing protein [Candidatus Rokuibacteriota bacterium]